MIMSMQAAAGIAGLHPKRMATHDHGQRQAFGITDPEIAKRVATGEIDLPQTGLIGTASPASTPSGTRARSAKKAWNANSPSPRPPEGVAATQQALTSAPPLPALAPLPLGLAVPATPQTPARLTAASKRSRWPLRLRRKGQKQYRLAPRKRFRTMRALDDMYTKAPEVPQLSKGNPPKGIPGLIERYGNYPGTFFDWIPQVSESATGSMDPELKRYGIPWAACSISRKRNSPVPPPANERKDLVAWIPDKVHQCPRRPPISCASCESCHQRPQTQHRTHRRELPWHRSVEPKIQSDPAASTRAPAKNKVASNQS